MNKWIYFVPCEATLHSRGYLSILLSGKPGTSSGECLLVDRNVKDVQLDHMHPTKQGFPSCYMEETDNHFFSQFMTWQPNYIIYIIYIGSVYLIILDYNPVSHECINLKKMLVWKWAEGWKPVKIILLPNFMKIVRAQF